MAGTDSVEERDLKALGQCVIPGCRGDVVEKIVVRRMESRRHDMIGPASLSLVTYDSHEGFFCRVCKVMYESPPSPWLKERKVAAEKNAIQAGHDLGEWTPHNQQVITASCKNTGCRAKAFLNTGEGVHGAIKFRRCSAS